MDKINYKLIDILKNITISFLEVVIKKIEYIEL
jgi:hypothetical protein